MYLPSQGYTFDVILTSSVQYFSAGCIFDVIGSIFGQQQLIMVNYACRFNQSETGKYFEWIIMIVITDNIFVLVRLSFLFWDALSLLRGSYTFVWRSSYVSFSYQRKLFFSQERFIPPFGRSDNTKFKLNVAVCAHVCWLFCVLYVRLFFFRKTCCIPRRLPQISELSSN